MYLLGNMFGLPVGLYSLMISSGAISDPACINNARKTIVTSDPLYSILYELENECNRSGSSVN